jgi:mycothiol synthase
MFDPASLRIVEATHDQETLALRLLLGGLEETQVSQQLVMLHTWVARHPAAGYRLLGAFRGQAVQGAILVQIQPGRTAVVWPPRLVDGESPETARQLLRQALAELQRPGIRMVQCLLPDDAKGDADLLVASGFRHVSDLLFLVCLARDFPVSSPSPEFQFEPYSAAQDARFAQLLDATYEGTLDCPAVNGIRPAEEVLDGYRATGDFDPQRWFIVRRQSEDIGCLILTDYPELSIWELIYVGLLPAWRGRRFGVDIVRHALWLCRAASRDRLVLAVDAANQPALKMYAAAGFQSWDRKSVYVQIVAQS